jgi:GNAT superfamily N-acetyltransferase
LPAPASPIFEPPGQQHDRMAFDCGVEALNHYLHRQAGQDVRKKIAAAFILKGDNPASIAGYYTLSATSINVGELPEHTARKLPRYPLLPSTLIGRLAVDRRYRGKGYGELLLADALKRAWLSTSEIGLVAVVVDAKDDGAMAFYRHMQFIPLVNHARRLFLPMAAVKGLFGK